MLILIGGLFRYKRWLLVFGSEESLFVAVSRTETVTENSGDYMPCGLLGVWLDHKVLPQEIVTFADHRASLCRGEAWKTRIDPAGLISVDCACLETPDTLLFLEQSHSSLVSDSVWLVCLWHEHFRRLYDYLACLLGLVTREIQRRFQMRFRCLLTFERGFVLVFVAFCETGLGSYLPYNFRRLRERG